MSKTDWSSTESVADRLVIELGTLYNTWIEDFRDNKVPLKVGRESVMGSLMFFTASTIVDLNQGLSPEMIEVAADRFKMALTDVVQARKIEKENRQ